MPTQRRPRVAVESPGLQLTLGLLYRSLSQFPEYTPID